MKVVASSVWEGWRYHNYTSSDGIEFYQEVDVLTWASPAIVVAREPAETPNDALPVGRPRVASLQKLSRGKPA